MADAATSSPFRSDDGSLRQVGLDQLAWAGAASVVVQRVQLWTALLPVAHDSAVADVDRTWLMSERLAP